MNIQVDPTSSNLASAMLNSKIWPRAVVGYGVKIFHSSPPNYVTRSPGCCFSSSFPSSSCCSSSSSCSSFSSCSSAFSSASAPSSSIYFLIIRSTNVHLTLQNKIHGLCVGVTNCPRRRLHALLFKLLVSQRHKVV